MSKKKQPPRMPVKKEVPVVTVQPEKKSAKGIIIAAAALVLIAAIVLTVVFVVKPGSNEDTTTTTRDLRYTVPGANGYTYVEYMGASMPQEFVDILTQAEMDRKSACQAYGTALEIGDIEISHPEFISYYYDQYSEQKSSIEYSIQKVGSNRTGYDPEVMPDEQKCINQEYTWAEEFTLRAIETIQANYRSFERALEKGIVLTESEVTTTISQFDVLELASKFQQRSVAELLEELYGKGYTESMFKAREIMLAYKEKYEAVVMQEFAASYTEEELQNELKNNTSDYTVIIGRVYPIEGDFDAAEVSKISTEAEFLAYANANYPKEGYTAETRTLCNYVNKETISSTFGPEVGEWMFSEERVAGEIAVVKGQLYRYLVYIEKLPYLSISRKVMYYGHDYDETVSAEDRAKKLETLRAQQEEWKNAGADADAFAELCYNNSGLGEIDVRLGDFYYVMENWIFDESRKPGDYEIVDSDVGCASFYYMGENEGDYDWKQHMKDNKSKEDFTEEYKADLEKNYEPKRNLSVIKKAYKTVNVTITRQIAEEKKEAEKTAQQGS